MKNFAIIGCAGYIAPRHLQAIKETDNKVIMALDKSDSVGILDRYFSEANFFTEFERFDRHAEKLRKKGNDQKIHFVSICSPNYLHDAHIRFALRIGADAICEKPLVINPWNLDALEELEKDTGKKVYTILQLRLHPSLIDLKNKIDNCKIEDQFIVNLTYITPRGKWYVESWKGDSEKSGGLLTNLGIHFFDMLIWIFGKVNLCELHYSDGKKISGYLEFERAKVKWFLSTDKNDLPDIENNKEKTSAYRLITVNGKEIEFSNVFTDLHTKVYQDILSGKGFGIEEAKPSINLVYDIKQLKPIIGVKERTHEMLLNKLIDSENLK